MQMTKSELKTGMIVTLANGEELYVFKDYFANNKTQDVIVEVNGNDCWHILSSYNENLTNKNYPEYNIVKVELVSHPYAMIRPDYNRKERKVLWTRKKQYTYAQLREILGEEFEVIG